MISEKPYIFSRIYESRDFSDRVVAGIDMEPGKKEIDLNGLFENGTVLRDYYSGEKASVKEGKLSLDTPHTMVLLGE